MTDSTASRRRGDDLERAIFEAALEELAEVGYANLRMEAVAARAKAGKASLYKRWPDRAHLIRAAARYKATAVDTEFEPSGDVRADMARVMRRITENQGGPGGEAMRGWVGELRAAVRRGGRGGRGDPRGDRAAPHPRLRQDPGGRHRERHGAARGAPPPHREPGAEPADPAFPHEGPTGPRSGHRRDPGRDRDAADRPAPLTGGPRRRRRRLEAGPERRPVRPGLLELSP